MAPNTAEGNDRCLDEDNHFETVKMVVNQRLRSSGVLPSHNMIGFGFSSVAPHGDDGSTAERARRTTDTHELSDGCCLTYRDFLGGAIGCQQDGFDIGFFIVIAEDHVTFLERIGLAKSDCLDTLSIEGDSWPFPCCFGLIHRPEVGTKDWLRLVCSFHI
jgi:hypothetical protein